MHDADEHAIVNYINGVELPSSVLSRFKCSDEYEKCDLTLLYLTTEALISPILWDKVQVRFEHLPDLKISQVRSILK